MAVEDDFPPVHGVVAADHVEEGGFSGAVGADYADDLALFHGEVDAVDGGQSAEGLGQSSYV
ncbi:hypothetical protein SDC9_136013 [bioreactor metagenome]|uniref:Uncharacterized protein n=1 Tax=bioreactor metagenome TaxID=1076179 RepID=A0A645DHY1_9ZZZZ